MNIKLKNLNKTIVKCKKCPRLVKFIKKVSSNKLPIKPLLPFTVSQNVSVWKAVKNNVPTIEYKITKKKLSIISKIFLLTITDIDMRMNEIGTNKEIKPIDWYKISDE